MKYNILTLADLHWGAMDAKVQAPQYEFIFDFIKNFPEKINLLVIAGDYWDSRIILNSDSAITGLNWMQRLYSEGHQYGIQKIRVIKGTKEHDNDQLESFRFLDDGNYFRIFTENTFEETLPGLNAIYCPEENMTHSEYVDKYLENISKFPNIGFFHGNLDAVMPQVAQEAARKSNQLIYEYDFWSSLIPGPMLAGHWHDGQIINNKWIYIGTPDRWEFGLESEPGIGYVSFDTDDNSFFFYHILNPSGCSYEDFYIDTSLFHTLEDYKGIIDIINKERENLKASGKRWKIRISILITDEKESNKKFLPFIKTAYANSKNVKIVVKDKLQKKRKKEERKRHEDLKERYEYAKDPKLSFSEKIKQYILSKHEDEDISLDEIRSVILKYLPDGKDG